MKRIHHLLLSISLAALLAGCDGGDEAETPTPFDVSGSWSGTYTYPGHSESIQAEIEQDGNSIALETTMDGVGHFLTGTINEDGSIGLTDGYDGQTWTSLGEQTPNHLFIRDYLLNLPSQTNGSPQEEEIILNR